MRLRELFDNPATYKWDQFDKKAGQASFYIGDLEYDVLITNQIDDEYETDEDTPTDADVEFACIDKEGNRIYDLTKSGNSNIVFATVVAVMRAYLTKYPVASLQFSAAEPSRQRLYTSMVKRLLPTWTISRRGTAFYAEPPAKVKPPLPNEPMKLRELFDNPVPFEWTTKIPNDRYVARFVIGELEYRFSAHMFPYDDLMGAEISFCLMDGKKCRTDNTGTGNANLIYATVISLIREVATKLKLARVAYDAADDKRKNIYPTLIKKALPGWALAEHEDDYYYFDRPTHIKEGVANAGQYVIDPGHSKFYNDDDEDEGRQLVKINVPAFDAAWRNGSHANQYIGAQGHGGIKGRYERFGQWLSTANQPIEASTVGVDDAGSVSFYNGRHRYCYLRDHGAKTIMVAMDPTSLRNAKKYKII